MCFRPTDMSIERKCPTCGADCDQFDTVCPECGEELSAVGPGAPGAPGVPGAPSAPGAPGVSSK